MKKPKMIQVVWMGEPLCKIYPHATRWQVLKYNIAMWTRKGLIGVFIAGAIFGVFKTGEYSSSQNPAVAFIDREVSIDKSDVKFKEKIEFLKDDVIEQLRKCESAGHKESDGIIIFDSNEKASIGTLQFQVNTVIHYEKILNGRDITKKEAVLIALDNKKAGDLAKKIIFETKNKAGKDWVNCAKKHNLDAQVDLIKKLEN